MWTIYSLYALKPHLYICCNCVDYIVTGIRSADSNPIFTLKVIIYHQGRLALIFGYIFYHTKWDWEFVLLAHWCWSVLALLSVKLSVFKLTSQKTGLVFGLRIFFPLTPLNICPTHQNMFLWCREGVGENFWYLY